MTASNLTPADRKDRRRARKAIFQIMYALDSTSDWSLESARAHAVTLKPPLNAGALRFVEKLLDAFFEHRGEIEKKIDEAHAHWKTSRMGMPERNVLRAAMAEISSDARTPVSVVISEANALADTFGGPDQSAFVGGTLNQIVGNHLALVREA